jgi:hypothetical protein
MTCNAGFEPAAGQKKPLFELTPQSWTVFG